MSLIELRPEEATRQIALSRLDEADDARRKFDDESSDDALHDFRVAVRRLRTTVRAFRDALGDDVSSRTQRQLRKLAKATNAGRDAEVHLEWVTGQRPSLESDAQAGADWLIERLGAQRDRAYGDLRDEVARDFARTRRKLKRRLSDYTVHVNVGDTTPAPRFAETLAAQVRDAVRTVAARLDAITGPGDEDAIHRARIAAKRLRYLLEPVVDEVDRAKGLVKALKHLQDALGELHDLDTLRAMLRDEVQDRDAPPGLDALDRRAGARRDELFDHTAKHWLGDAAAPFFTAAEEAAQSMTARGATAPNGDSPPMEIERKFLLSALPPAANDGAQVEIVQGWLPGARLIERLRRVTRDGLNRYYRTVKFGTGVARVEIEEETTPDVWAALWPLTVERRIAKRRHVVADGDLAWEIDDFAPRDLVIAEIELHHEDDAPDPPEWLAPYVVRDVTDDPAYTNFMLAATPPAVSVEH